MEPAHRPPFVIFLDIDGVLNPYDQEKRVLSKLHELFPRKNHTFEEILIAQVYCFSERALSNLDHLSEEINKTHQLQIVISSSWRQNLSPERLKALFRIHSFSQFITDKTVDQLSNPAPFCRGEHEISASCRAAEINQWLKDHPDILHFAVIDDYDEHLELNFKKRFIFVDDQELLSLKNVKAVKKLQIHP